LVETRPHKPRAIGSNPILAEFSIHQMVDKSYALTSFYK
jgi:hypothetical protein